MPYGSGAELGRYLAAVEADKVTPAAAAAAGARLAARMRAVDRRLADRARLKYEPCVIGPVGNCTRWSHNHTEDAR